MRGIERANEPKFDGILANSAVDFNAQGRLPRSKLVQIINPVGSLPLDHESVPDDLFGNVCEYKRLRKLDDFVSQRPIWAVPLSIRPSFYGK